MDPYEASVMPRMLSLRNDYVLEIESRISPRIVSDLIKMGVLIKPLPFYDYHMGLFHICWRDQKTGLLAGSADPRHTGQARGV
jgi:gamma-glutamyltranspeptidase/glutathione hydrolase